MCSAKHITVVGHRGAMGCMTENTIVSFRAAAAMGAEWVELDVQQTRDRHVVVFHDTRIGKDGPSVSDLSLAEIRELMEPAGVQVPTLNEVVAACKTILGLNIEVKDRGLAADLLLESIKTYDPSRVLVSSFMHDYLYDLHRVAPHIPLGLLMSSRLVDPGVLFASFDAAVLVQHFAFVDTAYVELIRSLDRKLWVWPLENRDDIRRMVEYGVDGIICDYPDRAVEIVGCTARCGNDRNNEK